MMEFEESDAAIITVRALSTRLHKKCFQNLFENKSMIEIVIERAKKIGCKLILATSSSIEDNDLEEIAKKYQILCFRGSLKNKIHRWYNCFNKFNLKNAAIIDADDPSFSFSTLNRALKQIKKTKAEIFFSSKKLMPGFITYGFNYKGIEKMFQQAKEEGLDTDIIDVFIQRAKLKSTTIEPLKNEIFHNQIRLTVDYKEDVLFYRKLFEKISYLSESSELLEIIKKSNISEINWFRHKEFLNNQKIFNINVLSDK